MRATTLCVLSTIILSVAVMTATSAAAAAAADRPPMSVENWGYDAGGSNQEVRPGDDFNAFANGTYLDNLTIPADQPSYGIDVMLTEAAERHIREILEAGEATPPEAAVGVRKARALYQAFMDRDRVDAAGAEPLKPDLAAISHALTRGELTALMGTSVTSLQTSLFDLSIGTDAKAPDRYAVTVVQSGLGLPDREHYLQPQFAAQKRKYRDYIAQILALIDWPDPGPAADAVLGYETRIAEASWSRVAEREPEKIYNPTTPSALAAAAPGFDWAAFLNAAGLGDLDHLVMQENTALPRLAAIYAETPMQTLRAWAAFRLVDKAAPNLAQPFADAYFAFHATELTGQPQQLSRSRQAVALVDNLMGEAVGRSYVAAYFPPQAKVQITAVVEEIREAFAARIRQADWLSPETRQRATRKLSQLRLKIGYPDRWRDYAELDVRADDLYGDVVRITAFEWDRQRNRLNRPIDHDEWNIAPQTVDAYYDPTANEIVFPAAILQAPYFDTRFDAAANYGGIGATIGHEMTHGFDDEGRYFDGTGTLVNWWTAEDVRAFDTRAAMLVAQYDQYEPYPGVHVNGRLTNGENIADLGGTLIALDAYHHSLHGQQAPVIDGLSGDQRFFLAYAQSWRVKRREAATRQMVVSNPHSPERSRINGVVRNIDAWYNAFSVQPGDRLYLDPTQRVHIW